MCDLISAVMIPPCMAKNHYESVASLRSSSLMPQFHPAYEFCASLRFLDKSPLLDEHLEKPKLYFGIGMKPACDWNISPVHGQTPSCSIKKDEKMVEWSVTIPMRCEIALSNMAGITNAWDGNWDELTIVTVADDPQCLILTPRIQLDDSCRMNLALLCLKSE